MWQRIKLIAEWLFDQLIYPWMNQPISRASNRQARRWRNEEGK